MIQKPTSASNRTDAGSMNERSAYAAGTINSEAKPSPA